MEAKFLASVLSFLSIFLAIYAQSLVNDDEDSTEFEFETAIYYGDSNVNLGAPFSITCIIPITDPIYWIKDGETITRHNLRHGRDEHSYILSESAIEGEKHKIEAHISVRHALKVHEGKYQCNNLHTSYHMLHVRGSPPIEVPKPQTKSPFTITSEDNQLSTESVYETIHDLTPSSADEIFTRTWDPMAALPAAALPTERTTHHRQHHHHHNNQQQQEQLQLLKQQQKEHERHKLIYINATHFDGNPLSSSASDSKENIGLINLEYMPPTNYTELTTVPWRSTTTLSGSDRRGSKHPPPPQFPPPRTTMLSTQPPPVLVHHSEHHYHGGATTANTAIHRNHYDQQQPHFPLQTIQPTYQQQQPKQHYTPMQTTYQTMMYPTQKPPLTPSQQYNQMQTYPPQQQQYVVPSVAGMGIYSSSPSSTTTTTLSMLQPKAIMPIISKEPDFLVPNYDNAEHQLKVYEIRTPLVLHCNITKDGDFKLTWEKNGTDVTKVKELEGRHRVIAAERKFIIDRTDIHDDGLYSCVANNQRKNINVVARVVVRVPSNSGVVEGEKLSIVCVVVGTDPQLSWAIGNLTISNSTGRYILKDDGKVQNAILSVENISLDDRGEYKCIGRNAANDYTKFAEASDVSYVRVKGKLAALWPFLGICAEVLILCTIILIYEKRRNKTELEESDTDPQEQLGLVH